MRLSENNLFKKLAKAIKGKLPEVSRTVALGIVLGVIFMLIGFRLIDSPKERMIKRELAQYKLEMKSLNIRMSIYEQVLGDLENRDDNIYRTILEAEPIHSGLFSNQVLNVDRYETLKGKGCTDEIINTTIRLDNLAKRLYDQSRSFDQVYQMACDKQGRLAAMPCIIPVKKEECTLMSGFGNRYHPILHTSRPHTGVDLAGRTGTNVYATADGRVTTAGRNNSSLNGYGNAVVIDHGYGYQTLYAHLNDIVVQQGATVKRGDLIGHIGTTGLSSGPHLHYEVILNNVKVNPVFYFFNDLNPGEYEKMIEIGNQENQCLS